jgi:hypothetical protein
MSTVVERAPVRTDADTRTPPAFGVLLLLLAAALLVNSPIGPLGLDLVDYPITKTLQNQLIGLEVVTLVLVVPWCGYAGIRVLRAEPGSALLAFGPARTPSTCSCSTCSAPSTASTAPSRSSTSAWSRSPAG